MRKRTFGCASWKRAITLEEFDGSLFSLRGREDTRGATVTIACLPTAAFWTGSGIVHDPVQGGLTTFTTTPAHAIEQVGSLGFEHLMTLPAHHPAPGRRFATEWWYYAFRNAGAPVS